MKDSVLVNGVVLTREQIEKAKEELDRPEFKRGDRVKDRRSGAEFFVLGGRDEEILRAGYSVIGPDDAVLVSCRNGMVNNIDRSLLQKVA